MTVEASRKAAGDIERLGDYSGFDEVVYGGEAHDGWRGVLR